ncbi:N-6 DNA methylase [Photobacterium iliopiscarium]|nr:N-6 DNA methylase [Photobacterium iliopiscarium]
MKIINSDELIKVFNYNAFEIFDGAIDHRDFLKYILPLFCLKHYSCINKDDDLFYNLYNYKDESNLSCRVDESLKILSEKNECLRGVFNHISYDNIKFGNGENKNSILSKLLSIIDDPFFFPHNGDDDKLIKICDSLLIDTDFYTPKCVSSLLSKLIVVDGVNSFYDPACGSGSILVECANQLHELDSENEGYELYGQEIMRDTWSIAKMNLFVHGEYNSYIEIGNTITEPKFLDSHTSLKKFDAIVSVPPFSISNWGHETALNDQFNRFDRGIPSRTKGDYAFILHMIKSLSNTGSMAIVVPHGVLFRMGSEGDIRKSLINDNILDAVIGLPEKMFNNTVIPVAILIFKKNKKNKNVIFIDSSNDFKLNKNKNEIDSKSLDKIIETYFDREVIDWYSHVSDVNEIINNDYNLNISRYVNKLIEEKKVNLHSLYEDRIILKNTLDNLEFKMSDMIKTFK